MEQEASCMEHRMNEDCRDEQSSLKAQDNAIKPESSRCNHKTKRMSRAEIAMANEGVAKLAIAVIATTITIAGDTIPA